MAENNDLKISVVTVCYNAVDTIEDTMLSVLNQRYPNIEYIIIDGGSTDGTVDIIKQYADRLAYWVSESDNGIYDAMNKGIDVATGDYINFLNSGDVFFKNDVIYRVVRCIKTCPAVIYGSIMRRSKSNELISSIPNPFFRQTKKFKTPGICHQAVFANTEILKQFHFDSRFKIAADYDFLIKVDNVGGEFQPLEFPIAVYDSSGISSCNHIARIREFAMAQGYNPHAAWINIHIGVFFLKRFIRKIIFHEC